MPRLALSLVLLLAACAPTLAERYDIAGLDQAIRRYYAEQDLREPDAACLRPRIHIITRAYTVEATPERLVLDVRYTYWDDSGDDGLFGGLTAARSCDGFATRRFTIDRQTGKIIDASGPRRVLR